MPAQAGIQWRKRRNRSGKPPSAFAIIVRHRYWIPACAGMTAEKKKAAANAAAFSWNGGKLRPP
jgi:hypothetical protein